MFRRETQAMDKIAQAEANAMAEVRKKPLISRLLPPRRY